MYNINNRNMSLITEAKIDQTVMRTSVTNRTLTINGEAETMYSVSISRTSNANVYNFTTQAFAAESTQSYFKGKGSNNINIVFPAAASGDTYEIKIFATKNTEFNFGKNKLYYSLLITQVGNAKIDLIASGTGITNTAMGDSTGSSSDVFASEARPTVVMNDSQVTVAAAASDQGYFITNTSTDSNNGTWDNGFLYWQTGNYVANGAGTDATALILDSVDDLFVGMQVGTINTVEQTDLRAITAINTTTKTLTLDGNETWSNDHVILFRAYGSRLIRNVIGIGVELTNSTVRLGQTTTNIHAEVTSDIAAGADIQVKSTQGIGKGATIRMRGINKSSSSSVCTIAEVSNASVTQGSITIANGEILASAVRPLRALTKIYVDGSSNKLFLTGTLSISKFPLADQNIYIDMGKILTKGTAS